MFYLYFITSPSARSLLLADWSIFFKKKPQMYSWADENKVLVQIV